MVSGRRNQLRKRGIQCVCTDLHVDEADSPPDQTQDVGSSVEQGRLGSPVPLGSGKHSRRDRVGENTGQVVDDTSDDDRLGSKTTGASLGHNSVTDGSDGGHVDQGLEDEQGSDGPGGSGGILEPETSGDQEANEHTGHSSHVKGSSTEPSHQEPTQDGCHRSDCKL